MNYLISQVVHNKYQKNFIKDKKGFFEVVVQT